MSETYFASSPDKVVRRKISPPIPKQYLGNVPLNPVSLPEALDLIIDWVSQKSFRFVVTPNVDHVMHLQRNSEFYRAYQEAALSLVDGHPLLWGTDFLGLPSLKKVSGTDLVTELCRIGAVKHWRIFCLGGHSGIELRLCCDRISVRFPGLVIGGTFPQFGFDRDENESRRIVNAIQSFDPDLILFGCGAPRSEIWMSRHSKRIQHGVGIGCGTALRYLAGLERRAPKWMRQIGMEWFWRLVHEPRRLWRRYLVDDMKFFPLIWKWKNMSIPKTKERTGIDGRN